MVTNALRLNLFDAGKGNRPDPDRYPDSSQTGAAAAVPDKNTINESEEKLMQKTIKIEGMMCPHCEAAVKKALEALEGVDAADVSHVAGTAVVSMSAVVADEALKEAVEAKDYKVTGIE